MGIFDRLHSIFTKNRQSEVGHLVGSIENSISDVLSTVQDIDTLQCHISLSTGEWLDAWGMKFGVIRATGEDDDTYRDRILSSVTNAKGTIPALIAAVERALGEGSVISAEETYNDLRIFNVSTFSGTGKFQDSDTVRLCVVKILINKPANQKLAEEIWKTRASGIRVIVEEQL